MKNGFRTLLSMALLGAALALAGCGKDDNNTTCASGQTLVNGVCQVNYGQYNSGYPGGTSCVNGQVQTQVGCVAYNQANCSSGQTLYNNTCYAITNNGGYNNGGYNNGYYNGGYNGGYNNGGYYGPYAPSGFTGGFMYYNYYGCYMYSPIYGCIR